MLALPDLLSLRLAIAPRQRRKKIRNPKIERSPADRNKPDQIELKLGKSKTLNSIPPVWSILVVVFFIILNLFRISVRGASYVLRVFCSQPWRPLRSLREIQSYPIFLHGKISKMFG
jgi:hypothetical protein